MKEMKYSVVLPVYNEAENIADMVKGLSALPEPPAEIRIVDDRSPDGTFQLAKELEKEFPCVRAMLNPGEKSLASSVTAGFDAAETEILLCMDADGQHRICDVPKLVRAISEGADMAIGSRYAPGGGFAEKWNFFRLLMSRTAALMAFVSLRVTVRDPMSGFFAVRKEAFRRIRPALSPDGFKIMLEILYLLTLSDPETRVKECGIVFELRKKGKSKLSADTILKYLRMLLLLFLRSRSLRRKITNAAAAGSQGGGTL